MVSKAGILVLGMISNYGNLGLGMVPWAEILVWVWSPGARRVCNSMAELGLGMVSRTGILVWV